MALQQLKHENASLQEKLQSTKKGLEAQASEHHQKLDDLHKQLQEQKLGVQEADDRAGKLDASPHPSWHYGRGGSESAEAGESVALPQFTNCMYILQDPEWSAWRRVFSTLSVCKTQPVSKSSMYMWQKATTTTTTTTTITTTTTTTSTTSTMLQLTKMYGELFSLNKMIHDDKTGISNFQHLNINFQSGECLNKSLL